MKQTSAITRRLAVAQEAHARTRATAPVSSSWQPTAHCRTRTRPTWLAEHAQDRAEASETREPHTVYRLYTESRDTLTMLVAQYFRGATLYSAVGLWEGQTEPSTTVGIIGVPSDRARVLSLARAICIAHAQSAVLVVSIDSREGLDSRMVSAS